MISCMTEPKTHWEWAAARELASMPATWTRLLQDHVADTDGRCRACRSQVRRGRGWPCSLYWLADQARTLHSA